MVLISISSISDAQSWDWAIHENIDKFAIDSAGNIFSHNDSTIKRFNSKSVFQWQKRFKGDLQVTGMVADNIGSLYIAGVFTNFSIDKYHFISNGNRDIFFCKIDSLGSMSWKKVVGGASDDNVTDLFLDKKQKILVCGDVGPGTVIGHEIFSIAELFIARYDLNGNQELLIRHAGGNAWEVGSDANGNMYLLGGIKVDETLKFGEGINLPGCYADCMGTHFIAKFNTSGKIIWAKDLGSNYYQPSKHLGIVNNGNFYLTNWSRYNGFSLSKFDNNGDLIFKSSLEGIYGDCNSLSIDNDDIIWLTGYIWNDPVEYHSFIWQCDPSDNLIKTASDKVAAYGTNIGNDYNNNIYVSGSFKNSFVFGTTTLFASAGNNFLAKINRKSSSILPKKKN